MPAMSASRRSSSLRLYVSSSAPLWISTVPCANRALCGVCSTLCDAPGAACGRTVPWSLVQACVRAAGDVDALAFWDALGRSEKAEAQALHGVLTDVTASRARRPPAGRQQRWSTRGRICAQCAPSPRREAAHGFLLPWLSAAWITSSHWHV